MQNKECKYIVTNSPAIEAAIVINGKGEALSWYSKKNSPIDEVAAISNNLVTIAHELCLFDTASVASMIFETSFGALNIRTIDTDRLLVLCLTEGYSFLTINRLLKKVQTESK